VRKLDDPEKAEWLLSFDFDGTLHHPADFPPVPREFFRAIERLRAERGAIWVINTGRSLGHFVEGLVGSAFPFLPDFAVVRESEIFTPNEFGRWVGVEPWNRDCAKIHKRFFRKARRPLARFRKKIEAETGAEWMDHDIEPAAIIARSEEEMEWICTQLDELHQALPDLGWQRNSIYLRFGHRDFHKGSALAEIARRLAVPSERTFAIGDGHNDLQMLDPKIARALACPANAIQEVKDHVASHNGHVASLPHGPGTIEALEKLVG